jgi:3-oxoacyl-ACP reductase-like protein
VVADQRVDGTGIQERLAPHRGPARLDRVAVRDRLEDVARGSGAERFEEVLLVVVHGQDEDPGLRAGPGQLPGGLEPRQTRHGDVEDGQVGPVLPRPGDGLGAVVRLGDHGEVGLGVQDEPDAPPH